VGITAADIYPASSWQFVFGLADLRERVAVVSHHRLHPEFQGLDPTPERRALASVRFLRVLAHEIAHTLGLTHCVTFQCIMNGCNSLDEQDQAPLHLCPVCLAKLAWRLRWRIEARYGGLAHLLYKLRLPGASRFFRRQFARLQPLSPTPEVLLGPRRATYTQRGSPPG
jgi:archaemetzincin